jgi:hypothetical protein
LRHDPALSPREAAGATAATARPGEALQLGAREAERDDRGHGVLASGAALIRALAARVEPLSLSRDGHVVGSRPGVAHPCVEDETVRRQSQRFDSAEQRGFAPRVGHDGARPSVEVERLELRSR